MRPELDETGAAAPPRINGELAFTAPWQSRLFATTMAACDSGLLDYDAVRDRLIDRIAERDDADQHGPDDYWAAWQDAVEGLVVSIGLVADDELTDRAETFAEHP